MNEDEKYIITKKIKEAAKEIGFHDCGISTIHRLTRDRKHLEAWLEKGYQGEMSYMERNIEKRELPSLLVEDAKSVISVIAGYYPLNREASTSIPNYAKYALGKDYHQVIKRMLLELLEFIRKEINSTVKGRFFVDSAPVFEKSWAQHAGLGWIGKNSLLISPQYGSFVLLGELITSLDLIPDEASVNQCGTCTKCIDACPTGALTSAYTVDASKCISYLNKDRKDDINKHYQWKGWVFGCDICQDVCPWNSKVATTSIKELLPDENIIKKDSEAWLKLEEEEYINLFKDTCIAEIGYKKLMENIQYVMKKNDKKTD